MSHKVDPKISHAKLHHHLTSGKPLNVKGYSHVVCVRKEKQEAWMAKGYQVILTEEDAVLVGKPKKQEKEEAKPAAEAAVELK